MFNKAVGAEDNTIMCNKNIAVKSMMINNTVTIMTNDGETMPIDIYNLDAKKMKFLIDLDIVEVETNVVVDKVRNFATVNNSFRMYADELEIKPETEIEDFDWDAYEKAEEESNK